MGDEYRYLTDHDPPRVRWDRLRVDYSLSGKQIKFCQLYFKTNNKTQAYRAAFEVDHLTYEQLRRRSDRLLGSTRGGALLDDSRDHTAIRSRGNVRQAAKSLLQEYYRKESESFDLTQSKVVQDLEFLKLKAAESIDSEKPAAGAFNGFVRATELQGRALGMFNEIHHHKHDLKLSGVDSGVLLKQLSEQNPEAAAALQNVLKTTDDEIIDAEYSIESDT